MGMVGHSHHIYVIELTNALSGLRQDNFEVTQPNIPYLGES